VHYRGGRFLALRRLLCLCTITLSLLLSVAIRRSDEERIKTWLPLVIVSESVEVLLGVEVGR
jgi:hypothetical protein